MKTLILGGVRSGKSRLAETLAETLAQQSNQQVVYIATATAGDAEMQLRIDTHKAHRSTEWIVVEEPLQLGAALTTHATENHCVIIDCLTLWLTNLLLADDKTCLQQQRQAFIENLTTYSGSLFIVSNETGLGIVPLGKLSRQFSDEAGMLNQSVAALCDRVVLTVAGLPLLLKGEPL